MKSHSSVWKSDSRDSASMALASGLAQLFGRDLTRLIQQIDAFPSDDMLWRRPPGITNAAGNLALHIEGNLREYIGRQLGGRPYERIRAREFTSSGLTRQEVKARITALAEVIPNIVDGLSTAQMEAQYPEVVLETPLSTAAFLVHLHGHLNWHVGQIDYLRRVLSGDGAITLAGLER